MSSDIAVVAESESVPDDAPKLKRLALSAFRRSSALCRV